VGKPGMVIMLPTKGYRKPAPTDARMSRMGSVKPLGAPAGHRGHSSEHRCRGCGLSFQFRHAGESITASTSLHAVQMTPSRLGWCHVHMREQSQ
jgi:hypothetical protein